MLKKVLNFIKSAISELKDKVSWPSYKMVQHNTSLVILGIGIATLLISGINYACQYAIGGIYDYF